MKLQRIVLGISALLLTACYTAIVYCIGYHSNRASGLAEPPVQETTQQAIEQRQTPPAQETIPTAEDMPAVEEVYLLKEYQGKIAVYCNNEKEPSTFLSIDFNSLRAYDQALFRAGITVHTKEEIVQLEEDFSS